MLIIWRYISGWNDLPDWELPLGHTPNTVISVIIAARNESGNIIPCLQSVCSQHYPEHLLEILVVDDHSTDETASEVRSLNDQRISLLRLQEGTGKKAAISKGVKIATGKLIVTTDADCLCPPNWLRLLASFYEQKQYRMIAAPVAFHQEKNLLERFQSLDFLGMMSVTGAGIHKQFMHMGNGANLTYEKETFEKLNGFEGIDHIASGDDILLMQKLAKNDPGQIGFLKNPQATVFTMAKPTWISFFSQRLRWATKSRSYQQITVTLILSVVFFFCCNIFLSFFAMFFLGTWGFFIFLFQFLVKTVADYFFLKNSCLYFQRMDLMKIYFPAQFLHIFYIIIIGTLGNLVHQYEWKNRRVR